MTEWPSGLPSSPSLRAGTLANMVPMSAALPPGNNHTSTRVAPDIWRLTWPILLANLSVVAMGLVGHRPAGTLG